MVDYRKLRLRNLTSPDFRHLFLLLFWPVYGLCFLAVERLIPRGFYLPVWCPLDDVIPFCEWFLIPYLFWFLFLAGMHVYLLLFDVAAFRKMMYFIILTYGVTVIIYLICPTCQELRPEAFARDNILTRIMGYYYIMDTNTNVCPSLHVVGSMAVAFAAWDTKRFQTVFWRIAFMAMALLISVSTTFVKQHSAVDVLMAFILCAVAYLIVYVLPRRKKKSK